MASEFGKKLKTLRGERSMTQEQLARSADLSLSFVAKLEQSDSDPSWTTVLALAKALGVDCTAFAGVSPPAPGAKPAKRKRG